ncbi:MAG: Panacea domain-containing protein [Clostridium sp.]|uniref:Panacea domain-containing protein n=1 Tax=Clostridium sp. TaxID=1506 RepID=UPI003F3EB19D
MTYNVMDVAQFIINYSNEKQFKITNLKLQKLLYYVQGAFLLEKNDVCFDGRIENWRHGPVINEVYQNFKRYSNKNIDFQEKYESVFIADDFEVLVKTNTYSENPINKKENIYDKSIIKKVIESYSKVDPWEMVSKTHEEDPWRFESEINEEITINSIKRFFKSNPQRIYGD